MTHKSVLVKVISILMIIFGGAQLLVSISLMSGVSWIVNIASKYGYDISALGWVVALVIIAAAIQFVAGIIGMASESRSVLMVTGFITIAYQVFLLIITIAIGQFGPSSVTAFGYPVLYTIGAIRCKE